MEKLSLGISSIEYTSKPQLKNNREEAGRLRNSLRVMSVSPEELATYIGKGCTFCNPFRGYNNKANCLPTEIITIDIDHIDKDLEAVKKAVKGIIYYPTFSDGKDGTHSYRVVIRLDKPLENRLEYAYYSNIIAFMLEEKGIERDKSCNEMERLFFGTRYKVEVYPAQYNYTKEELDHSPYTAEAKQLAEEKILKSPSKSSSGKRNALKSKGNDVCANFLRDFNNEMSYGALVRKYAYDFPIKYKDEVEFGEGELIKYVEDYKEVRNAWQWNSVTQKHELVKYQKDGDRKDKLFKRLIELKAINNFTFEGLLFAAVKDVFCYFDNSDNKLDRAWVLHTVKYVYDHDTYAYGLDKNKLNMPAIREQGLAWQSVVGAEKKKQNMQHIREVFDSSLNLKENYELFSKQGYSLSFERYRKLAKEMNLDYKSKKKKR